MTVPDRLITEEKRGTGPTLKPRDAATLILVDHAGPAPRVLMGRRRPDLAFMPGKYVFPGGRVDPTDAKAPACDHLPEALEARLLVRMRGRPSRRRARALAMTAVRETFEETGLLVGTPGDASADGLPEIWADYLGQGIVPALSPLRLVARAITPPGRPRRFDTRFFTAPADAIGKRLPLDCAPDGELEDICWLTFDAARDLDLPRITHVVLDGIEADLAAGVNYDRHPAVPFYHMRHGRFVRDMV